MLPLEEPVCPPLLRQRFRGTNDAVRYHLTSLEAAARARSLGAEIYGDVLLVMAEILNNVVEHAFAETEEGWIECHIRQNGEKFEIEISDNGAPLPPTLLGTGQLPDKTNDISTLPEGGFGWFIVHSLAQDMIYEREDGQNRLTFSMWLT